MRNMHTSNWKEIAGHLPGRTQQACRKYYRQMKARCDRWTLARQNTLCKVYESQKVEMWTKIGGTASVPWQFAEQMCRWYILGLAEGDSSLSLVNFVFVSGHISTPRAIQVHVAREHENWYEKKERTKVNETKLLEEPAWRLA
ncbi:hypothetical protein E4U52_006944 [Claviceps spartinae]|nr:hypothetical protein E4U52_006944 [Claviceps spartinae]